MTLPNTTARSDRTLVFSHPERGLFVFSNRPLVRGGASPTTIPATDSGSCAYSTSD